MDELFESINIVSWVIGNVLVAYIAVGVIVFVIMYFILFDPTATTAGKLIFRFMLSIIGVTSLVFIGTYIDPASGRAWYILPHDVEWWRPVTRLLIYIYVSYTISSLAILLGLRKWRPYRVKAAPDLTLVKVRHDTQTTPVIPTE